MKDKLAELFGIDVRSLAVFRMGLGILLLVDLAIRAADFTAHYTNAGVLPWSALADYYGAGWRWHGMGWRWSLHALGDSVLLVGSFLFASAAIAAICLALGYRTRIATCVSWLLLASLHTRNPLVINAGDTLLRILLFWSMFLPLGRSWSLDAALRGAPRHEAQRIVGLATACILLQVCLMYWMTAYFKLNDVWRGGAAMYYVVSFDAYARPLAATLARFAGLMGWLSRITVWGELLAPVLVFFPVGTTLLRIAVIAFFILLHAGIELTMTVGLFSYVSILGWVLFLPTPCWDSACRWWTGGESTEENRSLRNRWAWDGNIVVSALAMVFLVLVLLWNLSTSGWTAADGVRRAGPRKICQLTMLMQDWRMFARPTAHDGWCVLAARLKDGRWVDLRRGGVPLSWQRPAHMAQLDPNHRWRKYYLNLVNERNSRFRGLLCQSMAREWDRAHPPGEAVMLVDLYWVEEKTMPRGEPPRMTQVLLHRERIRSQGAFLDALEETREQTGT